MAGSQEYYGVKCLNQQHRADAEKFLDKPVIDHHTIRASA